MAYRICSLDELKLYIDVRYLIQLTQDSIYAPLNVEDAGTSDPDSLIDQDVLEAFENSAAKTIENHLRNVYEILADAGTDGENAKEEIRWMCGRLTHVYLWRRRGTVPEWLQAEYVEIIDRLKAMTQPDPSEVLTDRIQPSIGRGPR